MLDAVTSCINYSDFLRLTVKWNRKRFDRWMIVTVPEDHETIQLCREYDLMVCLTERVQTNQAQFNLGAILNDGIKLLRPQNWLAVVDADIIILEDLKPQLKEPKFFYSTHRSFLPTWEDFVAWLKGAPLAASPNHEFGYGFLQVVNVENHNVKNWYEECFKWAANSDLTLRSRWEEKHQQYHFTRSCVHLGPTRYNWEGRITNKFYTPEQLESVCDLFSLQ
jgi:hypothetical protein